MLIITHDAKNNWFIDAKLHKLYMWVLPITKLNFKYLIDQSWTQVTIKCLLETITKVESTSCISKVQIDKMLQKPHTSQVDM